MHLILNYKKMVSIKKSIVITLKTLGYNHFYSKSKCRYNKDAAKFTCIIVTTLLICWFPGT